MEEQENRESRVVHIPKEEGMREASPVEKAHGFRVVKQGKYTIMQDRYYVFWEDMKEDIIAKGVIATQGLLDRRNAGSVYVFDEDGAFPLCSYLDQEQWEDQIEEHAEYACEAFHVGDVYGGVEGLMSSEDDRLRRAVYLALEFQDPDLLYGGNSPLITTLIMDPSPRVSSAIAEASDSAEVLEFLTGHWHAGTCAHASDRLEHEFDYLDADSKPITAGVEAMTRGISAPGETPTEDFQ